MLRTTTETEAHADPSQCENDQKDKHSETAEHFLLKQKFKKSILTRTPTDTIFVLRFWRTENLNEILFFAT